MKRLKTVVAISPEQAAAFQQDPNGSLQLVLCLNGVLPTQTMVEMANGHQPSDLRARLPEESARLIRIVLVL